MRATIPRRMLTSCFSRPARAKSRRSRGNEALRHRRIEDPHGDQRPLAMIEERRDLVRRRRRETRRAPDRPAGCSDAQFVGGDLDRGGEIERRIIHVRRNRRDDRAARELRVRQPGHFGAEHERHVAVRSVRDGFDRGVANRRARARRTRGGEPKVRSSNAAPASASSSVATTRRVLEQGSRARRESARFGIRKPPRRHEDEPRESHGVHRARGGADVARVARSDKNYADDAQPRKQILSGIRGVGGRHTVTIRVFALRASPSAPSGSRPHNRISNRIPIGTCSL